MPLYLLDTDHMTVLYWGGEPARRLAARLTTVPKDDYGTTIVSFEEQTRGWLSEVALEKTERGVVPVYERLNDMRKLYQAVAVWQYADEAAEIFTRLRKERVRIGAPDLRIASIALANNATVLTANRKHFGQVPGLSFEDWTR